MMIPDMTMRPMTLEDVGAALAIEQSVQPYPWTQGNFCDALASGYLCYVTEQAGELCAFAVLMSGVDEAELLNIAVSAAQQRKGVGRAMLAAMLEVAAARQWTRVFLEVRAGNTPAVLLYQSAGFAAIGVRRGYYHNAQGSEDAVVMACNLSHLTNPTSGGEALQK